MNRHKNNDNIITTQWKKQPNRQKTTTETDHAASKSEYVYF